MWVGRDSINTRQESLGRGEGGREGGMEREGEGGSEKEERREGERGTERERVCV